MTAGLDLVSQMTPQTAEQGLSKAPSTFTERFSTAISAFAVAPDDFWNARNAQSDRFQKIADDYYALKNERLLNPFDVSITREEMRKYPNMPIPYVLQKRLEVAREKTRLARDEVGDRGGVDPDFLNVDRINTAIGQTGEAMRHANEALVGTGYGAAAVAGEIVGSSVNPINIAAGLVPVSRLPMAVAEGIGRTFLGNVGREALLQAGVGAAASVVGEAAGYGTRAQFGTAPTTGEITSNILGGGVGGALFGGGLRGLHLGVSRLIHGPQVAIRPGEYGPAIEVPQTVKDAQVVMQTGDLYGHSNKLGIPEPAHDRAFLAAAPDVVAGRGAVVDMELPGQTIAEGIMERVNNIRAARDLPPLPPEHFGVAPATTAAEQRVPITAYHGTGRTFENFDMKYQSQDAIFLTDKAEIAQRHAGDTGRVLKTELSLDNPKEVDWGGGLYNTERMNDVIREAKDAGHDGLIIKNIRDFSGPETSTTYAVFKPESARIVPEAAPPVPAAEAEKAVADARLQGAAAEAAPTPGEVAPVEGAEQQLPGETAEDRAVLQRLVDEVRNPPVEEGRPDFAAAATPTKPEEVVPKTAAVQNEEAKAVIAEAQALVERPDRAVPRELREALAKATDDEAEAAIAVACLAGGGAL